MDFLDTPTGIVLLILVGVLPFAFLLEIPLFLKSLEEPFGLERNQQEGLFELSRLCVDPELQKKSIILLLGSLVAVSRGLVRDANVRAILSYADSAHHSGIIYRACNFTYYGLTDSKKDFYYSDGTKHSRGSVKGADGEWRDRTRKHRYLMVFDKKLEVLWEPEKYATI